MIQSKTNTVFYPAILGVGVPALVHPADQDHNSTSNSKKRMIVGLQTPGQRRGRKSAVGQKTDARARFPRYAVDDVPGRRRALQLLRALDRGLPSAALFRICGAAKRRCRPALAIGLGSGSALCVPAQSMLLYAGAEARTEVRALPSQMPSLGQANPVGFSRLYPASHQGRRARTALRGPGLSRISRSSSCSSRSTIYHATHDPTVLSMFLPRRWSMRASISSARFLIDLLYFCHRDLWVA